ncbi:MAG: hypothetical protein ROR55_25180 [Devosia sp.]
MALKGTGAVAIWHDIDTVGREAFYAWHGVEHMAERVGINGFNRGRRYRALNADLEFFNLYEADTPVVLTGQDYQKRLNSPTPWTVETVKHFRKVNRSICKVARSMSRAEGALCTTWRYDVDDAHANAHLTALDREVFDRLGDDPAVISGAHVFIADRAASAVDTAERKARGELNRIPAWVLMVEGWGDAPDFARWCRDRVPDAMLMAAGAEGTIHRGVYQLQISVTDC